jgi:hypothetical protein
MGSLSLPLQLLRDGDWGWESGTQDGVDVDVDFDFAVSEVEEWGLGIVVGSRSWVRKLRFEKVGEGLGEGWLIVVMGSV